MLQTKTRPFTVAERERLEAELLRATTDPKPDYGAAFSFGLLFALLAGMLALMLAGVLLIWDVPQVWVWGIAAGFAILGFVLGFVNQLKQSASETQARKEYAATLATRLGRGEIEETTVMASAVAHVTDGDEVDGYFFDIGDNRVLFLWSMDMWDDASDETPLSTAFTFTHFDGDSGSIYAFVETGEPLAPVHEFAFTSYWNDALHSGAVFENLSLATLETNLPYLTAAPDETGAP